MPARCLRSLLIPVAVAVAVAAGGCSGSTSDTPGTTTAATAGTTTGTSARNVVIDTASGQASLSLDGQLPPGWPAAFPIPPGATPAGSGSLIKDQSGGMVAVYRLSGTPQVAFSFYTDNKDLNITDASSVGLGQAFVGRAKLNGTYQGSVSVGGAGGGDLLVIVLSGAPGVSTSTTAAGGTATSTTPTTAVAATTTSTPA
jgi:hypothetical protein